MTDTWAPARRHLSGLRGLSAKDRLAESGRAVGGDEMEEVGASQPESWDWQLRGARFLREAEGDQARASPPHPHASQTEKPSVSWAYGPGGPGVVTQGAPTEAGHWALRERLA